MFTLKEDITFSQVCEIDIPLPGGGFETSKLKCEFKLIDKATTEAAFEADENGGDLLEQAFIRPLDPIAQEGVDGAIEFTEKYIQAGDPDNDGEQRLARLRAKL